MDISLTCGSFVEFETAADLRTAVEKLDGREFKGIRVTCVADVSLIPEVFAFDSQCPDSA